MKELITLRQANDLILAFLVVAPVIGLIWGVVARRIAVGLGWGIAVGAGNLLLWKLYNAITDRLGLDTVKNLLVNLVLFVAVGVIAGSALGFARRRVISPDNAERTVDNSLEKV